MKTLLIPAPPYKYALSWAHEVIDHLIAQHARATELVMAAMDISTRDLAKLLAKPDPEWNYVRTRIKYLHTRIVERGYEPDIYTIVEWIYGTRPTGERLNRFTRLDRELKRTRLGEQGLGGTGGAEAQLALPFLFKGPLSANSKPKSPAQPPPMEGSNWLTMPRTIKPSERYLKPKGKKSAIGR